MPTAKKPAATAAPAPVEHGSIHAALVAFQAEIPAVTKNKTARVPTKGGGNYSYTYADLADTSDAILPVLTRHGLGFVSVPRQEQDGRYSIVGTLFHESGGTIEGAAPLHGQSPQELGSSITYMRRYLMCAMTGVVADDDDDGQRAQAAEGRTQGTSTDTPEPAAPQLQPHQQIVSDRLQAYGPGPKATLLKWWQENKLPAPSSVSQEQAAWVMERLDDFDQRAADAAEQAAATAAAERAPQGAGEPVPS